MQINDDSMDPPSTPPWFAWEGVSVDEDGPGSAPRDDAAWLDGWVQAARTRTVLEAVVPAAEAQAGLAARLVHDGRVAGAPGRLALAEAADAMWLAGDAGARDRLALYAHGVQGAIDTRDLQADWALRQLHRAGDPSAMSVAELRAFLGLVRRADGGAGDWTEDQVTLFPRPQGTELDQGLAEWRAMAGQVAGQHRLVRAVILHRAWRWLGLSAPEDAVTPLVVACRVAAPEGLPFAPLAGAARRLRTFAQGGAEAARLVAMLGAFGAAAREASSGLERLAAWRARADGVATTRAARAVVGALATRPVASSKGIAAGAGLTPQAVNGAARALLAKDLISEATGQSRFRLWQARL